MNGNGGINNNFGLFGIPGGSYESTYPIDNLPDKSDKNNALISAIKEIQLNTPDSIGIAIELLKDIEIPSSLTSLSELHKTVRSSRNEKFAADAHRLQKEAINELKKLLV
jgi:hypothetical protein